MKRAAFLLAFLGALALARGQEECSETSNLDPYPDEQAESNLLFLGVDGTSYDNDGLVAWQKLRDRITPLGHKTTYLLLNQYTQNNVGNLDQFTQIWVYDLSSGTDPGLQPMWDRIAAWYAKRPVSQIICDGRIISTFWRISRYGEVTRPTQLLFNFWEQMRLRGGGLFTGTDHDAYPRYGVNALHDTLKINRYFGNYRLTYIPVDQENPIIKSPSLGAFYRSSPTTVSGKNYYYYLYDNSSPGSSPYGQQPNGAFFYTVAWHSGNPQTPGISTTIRGLLNFQVRVATPTCDQVFQYDTATLSIKGDLRVASKSPYTWSWSSDRDGSLGSGQSLSVKASSLRLGKHVIKLSSRDGQGQLAVANVRVYIRLKDGDSCSSAGQCISGKCTDGVCCTQSTCGHGKCAASTGKCSCDDGFGGLTCSSCATNYYGSACTYCLAATTCSNHGSCDASTGACNCQEPWEGPSCKDGPLALCGSPYKEVGGRCVYYSAAEVSWNSAQTLCRDTGGSLASPTSSSLDAAMFAECANKDCWIGLNDKATEGSWTWVADGHALGAHHPWLSGSPASGTNSRDCVAYGSATGGWTDELCSAVRPVLCEKEAACPAGQYKDGSNCRVCPMGTYRAIAGGVGVGACSHCPAGTYGSSSGQTKASCSAPCPAGKYCPAGSSSPTICPAGRFGSTTGIKTVDCSGQIAAGYYGGAGEVSATPTGKRVKCGRYSAGGATSSSGDGPCTAGYHCPAGAAAPTQKACGSAAVYCPAGACLAAPVASGYRSIGGSGPSTRTGQEACAAGNKCAAGVMTPCAAGTYSATSGATSCSACTAGYFCPQGSSSSTAEPCGGGSGFTPAHEWYCPAGTSERKKASAGYCTDSDEEERFRSSQSAAPTGFDAVQGLCVPQLRFVDSGGDDGDACAGQGLPAASGGAFSGEAVPATSVVENAVAGTTAMTLSAVRSDGSATGVTYSIVSQAPAADYQGKCPSASSSPFSVSTASDGSAVVTTKAPIDHEACGAFDLKLQAVASGVAIKPQCAVTMRVQDANDVPVCPAGQSRNVVEDTGKSIAVGSPIQGTDQDATQELRWTILSGNTGDALKIGTCDGQLSVRTPAVLDFEARQQLSLGLRLCDDNEPTPACTTCSVTVGITERQEPPEFSNGTVQTIGTPENVAVGGRVGSFPVGAVDPDAGQNLTYSIETNAFGGDLDSVGIFGVDPGTGWLVLRRAGALDFESSALREHRLVVAVADNGLPQMGAAATVVVKVSDVAEAPVLPADGNAGEAGGVALHLPETAEAGDAAGSVVAHDDDTAHGDVLEYSLTNDAGGRFTIDTGSGAVRLAAGVALDHETADAFTIGVAVVDQTEPNGLLASKQYKVLVDDVNEAPALRPGASSPLERSVRESTAKTQASDAGLDIGAPLQDDVADQDEDQTLAWTIAEVDVAGKGLFAVDVSTGQLSVLRPLLDFEASTNRYGLTVRATDDGISPPRQFADFAVVVSVTNVNEPPACADTLRNVSENALAGTTLSRPLSAASEAGSRGEFGPEEAAPLPWSDVDAGDTVTFEVAEASAALVDRIRRGDLRNGTGQFAVSPAGVLAVAAGASPLDRESVLGHLFGLTVRCTDSGGLSDLADITVVVEDRNEPPVVRSGVVRVGERSDNGTLVGAPVSATDPEAAGDLAFAIVAGNTDGTFAIQSPSGQLVVAHQNAATFTSGAQYNLTVVATDVTGLEGSAVVAVDVTDVNFPPSIPAASASVPENAAAGTLVAGPPTVSDPDPADTHSFRLEAALAGVFAVDAATGAISIADSSALDFETQSGTIQLGLVVTDQGGLEGQATVTVALADENEPPSLPPPGLALRAVLESAAAGGPVLGGPVAAEDPDVDDEAVGQLQYSLAWPSAAEAASTSTAASLAAALEATASSQTTPNASSLAGMLARSPLQSASAAELAEVLAASAALGAAEAQLPFTIDADSGSLAVAEELDHEQHVAFAVAVEVTDHLGLQDRTVVVVVVGNVNEPPQLAVLLPAAADGAVPVPGPGSPGAAEVDGVVLSPIEAFVWEDAAAGTLVARIQSSDEDAESRGNRVSCAVSSGDRPEAAAFAMEASNGALSVAAGDALDYEDWPAFDLTVSCSDNDVEAPIEVSFVLPVRVGNRNDMAIEAISGAVPHGTAGGGVVFVNGTGLGWTSGAATRPAARRLGIAQQPSAVAAWYEPEGAGLTGAINASAEVSVPGYQVVAVVAEGVGHSAVWTLEVDGLLVTSGSAGITTSYRAPSVDRVACELPGNLPTGGGAVCTLTGADFGPEGSFVTVQAWYGSRSFPAYGCSVTVAHVEITCEQSPMGAGSGLTWTVTVGGQRSAPLAGSAADHSARFEAPRIDSLRILPQSGNGSALGALPTTGGAWLEVRGSSLGPAVWALDGLAYGPAAGADDELRLSAAPPAQTLPPAATEWTRAWFEGFACEFVEAHTALRCRVRPGVGSGLGVRVGIAGQWSPLPSLAAFANGSAVSVDYERPVLESASGAATEGGTTAGGEALILRGRSLGPPARLLPPALRRVRVVYGRGAYADGTTWPRDEFEADSCAVQEPGQTSVRCVSGRGVGSRLQFSVSVGGVFSSSPLPTAARYSPPVLFLYSGEGATGSHTTGGDEVLVEGRHLGFNNDHIELVQYSVSIGSTAATVDDGDSGGGEAAPASLRVFRARNCTIFKEHTMLRCVTAPGAGAGMRWEVTVGGQRSTTPTTAYAPPQVLAVEGPGASEASAVGGQFVVLTGLQFGPPTHHLMGDWRSLSAWAWPELQPLLGAPAPFLGRVTFGPSGGEYVAEECAVTQHTQLVCRTAPAIGSSLAWQVEVEGQRSEASAAASSVAKPVVVSSSFLSAGTTGGTLVSFYVTDAGSLDPTSQVFLLWGAGTAGERTLAPVRSAEVAQRQWSNATVIEWNAERASGNMTIDLLEGGGAGADDLASGSSFDADGAPIEAEDADGEDSGIEDTPHSAWDRSRPLEKVSFCVPEGQGAAIPVRLAVGPLAASLGSALVAAAAPQNPQSGDAEGHLLFSYAEPAIAEIITSPAPASAEVGGSRVDDDQALSPTVIELLLLGVNFGTDPVVLLDGAAVPVAEANHTAILCYTGSATGSIQVVAGGQSSAPRSFSDLSPGISALTDGNGNAPRFSTSGGEVLTLRGQNFARSAEGFAQLGVIIGEYACALDHEYGVQDVSAILLAEGDSEGAAEADRLGLQQIQCAVPAGEGVQVPVRVFRGAQASLAAAVDYRAPTVTHVVLASGGRAADGLPVASPSGHAAFLVGDDFGTSRQSAYLYSEALGFVAVPVRPRDSNHTHLALDIPAGVGRGATLFANVAEQQSLEGASFHFAAPTVRWHTRAGPTTGFELVLLGAGFGDPSFVGRGGVATALTPSVRVGDMDCPVSTQWNDSTITAHCGEGAGLQLPLSLSVAGQTAGVSSEAALGVQWLELSFQAPEVRRMTPTRGPAEGGFLVTLEGENFGPDPWVVLLATGQFADAAPGSEDGARAPPSGATPEQEQRLLALQLERCGAFSSYSSPPALTSAGLLPPAAWELSVLDAADAHVVIRNSDLDSHSHTNLSFTMPPLQGSDKLPIVVSGCQLSSVDSGVSAESRRRRGLASGFAGSFVVNQPRVLAAFPTLLPTDKCSILTLQLTSVGLNRSVSLTSPQWSQVAGASQVGSDRVDIPCTELSASLGSLPPGFELPGEPASFYPDEELQVAVDAEGAWTESAVLGAASLPPGAHATTMLCVVPGGIGTDVSVVVESAGHRSVLGSPSSPPLLRGHLLAFHEPLVTSISPRIPDADGQAVILRGENFGVISRAYAGAGIAVEAGAPLTAAQAAILAAYLDSRDGKLEMFDRDLLASTGLLDAAALETLPPCQLAESTFAQAPPLVFLGNLTCASARMQRPTPLEPEPYVLCDSQLDTVGDKPLNLTVALQTSSWPDGRLRLECTAGAYGIDSETCLDCPDGASCPGGLVDPLSEAGWYGFQARGEEDTARWLCHPERQWRPECPYFLPCLPSESCLGENTCADEYEGERCAQCVDGFYRTEGLCKRCPDTQVVLVMLAVFVVAGIGLTLMAYLLNTKSFSLVMASITVDYLQALAIFVQTRIAWPPAVAALLRVLSAFNFNIDIAAPECLINFSYVYKWLVIESLPVAALLLLTAFHAAGYLYNVTIKGRTKDRFVDHFAGMVSLMIVMVYFLFLSLTRTALEVFNCNPSSPPSPDGKLYLDVVFEECGKPGGVQLALLPFAITALLLYVLVYPIVIFLVLHRNRRMVLKDQIMIAMGVEDNAVPDHGQFLFRRRYGRLYGRFRPESWYWLVVLLGRKVLIAFTGLFFRSNPGFQMAFLLLVFFFAYLLQARHHPYMSPGDHSLVLYQHEVRALRGGPQCLEALVKADIASDLVKSGHKSRAQKRDWRSLERKLLEERLGLTTKSRAREMMNAMRTGGGSGGTGFMERLRSDIADATATDGTITRTMRDYNSVESALLVFPILVSLAGVMFESERLQEDYYTEQRNALGYVTLGIILVSLVYLAFAIAYDLYRQLGCGSSERKFRKLASDKGRERLMKKSSAKRRRAPMPGAADLHPDGEEGGAEDAADKEDGDDEAPERGLDTSQVSTAHLGSTDTGAGDSGLCMNPLLAAQQGDGFAAELAGLTQEDIDKAVAALLRGDRLDNHALQCIVLKQAELGSKPKKQPASPGQRAKHRGSVLLGGSDSARRRNMRKLADPRARRRQFGQMQTARQEASPALLLEAEAEAEAEEAAQEQPGAAAGPPRHVAAALSSVAQARDSPSPVSALGGGGSPTVAGTQSLAALRAATRSSRRGLGRGRRGRRR